MYRSVNAVTSSGVFNYVFTLPSPPQPRSTLFPYTTLFRSRGLPGFVKVVSRGNYVAVVFEREEQAIAGARDRLFFTLEDDGDVVAAADDLDEPRQSSRSEERRVGKECRSRLWRRG